MMNVNISTYDPLIQREHSISIRSIDPSPASDNQSLIEIAVHTSHVIMRLQDAIELSVALQALINAQRDSLTLSK